MRPLFQTRFPRFYRKRSGDRDVSARATHLKAAMENVFMTTTERKRMSTKTTFKRIALVAVAALGLGVLSVAPSSAAPVGEVLTLSATTASVSVGETATTTATVEFTTGVANDTLSVVVQGSGAVANSSAGAGTGIRVTALKTDSVNATLFTTDSAVITTRGDTVSVTNASAGIYVKAKFKIDILAVANVGTWTYSIYTTNITGAVTKTGTFTVTVAAKDTTPTVGNSKIYLNGTTAALAKTSRIEADSALVVAAGASAATIATPVAQATIWSVLHNASDTDIVTGTDVSDSVTLVMTGPGLLSIGTTGSSTKAKQVLLKYNETAVVWSDGTAGVGTISAYIGSSATSSAKLTQAAKTITFYGAATTFTATLESTTVRAVAAESATAGRNFVSFVAKDSASNVVKDAGLNVNGAFYAISSDTKVISADSLGAYSACTYSATYTKWICTMNVVDSGTATITIGDSFTVASSTFTSAALSVKAAGAAFTGTLASDKSSYTAGEKAIITVTSKDRGGRSNADGAAVPYSNLKWDNLSATFGTGSDATDIIAALNAGGSFVSGVDTYVVYMPTVAGTYVLKGMTSGETVTASAVLTFTVVDPTKDAADAATDAALEATDAAYAAQDAAQLAAEAADAATAAAEAATAAVEDLATKVAGLFADLQKQITTLANVVAKIAKKVKA